MFKLQSDLIWNELGLDRLNDSRSCIQNEDLTGCTLIIDGKIFQLNSGLKKKDLNSTNKEWLS